MKNYKSIMSLVLIAFSYSSYALSEIHFRNNTELSISVNAKYVMMNINATDKEHKRVSSEGRQGIGIIFPGYSVKFRVSHIRPANQLSAFIRLPTNHSLNSQTTKLQKAKMSGMMSVIVDEVTFEMGVFYELISIETISVFSNNELKEIKLKNPVRFMVFTNDKEINFSVTGDINNLEIELQSGNVELLNESDINSTSFSKTSFNKRKNISANNVDSRTQLSGYEIESKDDK